jgi:transcription initiation factor IIE alpha subunit
MPDLTLITVPICSQLEPYKVNWSVGGYIQNLNRQYELECSCKGFQFRHSCKHVKELEETRCTWHGAYDEEQTEEGTCPRCGSEVTYVRMGV